ncbi:DnaJ-domain-containing protein [Dichomitus squalens]|uniref:DnaJ-domain-containing protein n=1 Tax=Dichomitus squalens TaxID=114155 RepID=A0A4Q9MXC6_9APHY|nr:DnaJ-domain-containing protein [Dichomitus squalens]TBU47059.1 DnaJ-domain-containing protein [Dichomitus squalens]
MPGNVDGSIDAGLPPDDQEHFYSVLNLPKTASDQEIRERYRQLSIVFHPDKQVDERRKEAATQRFLEVQKAYEVLSDPVTRRAYDILGPEGLQLLQSADFKHVAEEEFEDALRRQQREQARLRVEQAVHPRGNITIGFDASSLFDDEYAAADGSLVSPWQNFLFALHDVRKNKFSVRHRIQAEVSKKTWLVLASRVTLGSGSGNRPGGYVGSTMMGTVRHHFSPRLDFEATTSLLSVSGLILKSTYRTDDYVVTCQSELSSAFIAQPFRPRRNGPLLLPPLSVSVFRRLFPKSPTQGMLEASISPTGPRIAIGVTSSAFHDSSPDRVTDDEPSDTESPFRAPSSSGLALYSSDWQLGFDLAGLGSGLNGRYGITFLELGVTFQTVLRLGFAGFTWLAGGDWRGNNAAIGANVSVNSDGVVVRVDATYHGQTLTLPIILSHEHNQSVGLWAAVLPSTVLALVYHFRLRPRHRKQRLTYLQQARQQLREEKSDLLRQCQETILLLQDTASRHMRAEEACDGLVILDARYGPSERDEGTEGLDVDVTIPVRALVNSSQLYIPGKRSKAGIPGFYDPVAGVPKTLRVRYRFRGREHYAEIPDSMPVVLPLKGTLRFPTQMCAMILRGDGTRSFHNVTKEALSLGAQH